MTPDLSEIVGASLPPSIEAMFDLLRDPGVSEITINGHTELFYTKDGTRRKVNRPPFASVDEYILWIEQTLQYQTNSKYGTLAAAEGKTDVIEASFRGVDITGSIHVVLPLLTRGQPIVTVRKQPREHITLEDMMEANMLDRQIRDFLIAAMRGRLNILVSGGSGAGKTTMIRALARYVDPAHRVLTVEEIDELHLQLPNVVPLFTATTKDADGRVVWETTLDDLCRHALRMRPDRIWVGEVRGREAYSLVKACNTGHDGSLTTVHSEDPRAAIENLTTYVMEAGVTEDVARDSIVRAFDLIVHIKRTSHNRRVVSEVTEVESVVEGRRVRLNTLFEYNPEFDGFIRTSHPTPELVRKLRRYGVNNNE